MAANTTTRDRRKSRKSVASKKSEVEDKGSKTELHQSLDEFQLDRIHDNFQNEKGKRFNSVNLRKMLQKVARLTFPDDEFDIMFMKMNSKR